MADILFGYAPNMKMELSLYFLPPHFGPSEVRALPCSWAVIKGVLPHLAQWKDPSYRIAEVVVSKTDSTTHPPPVEVEYLNNRLLDPTQI